jgi:DNA-binding HxlR family transcriptional regulator
MTVKNKGRMAIPHRVDVCAVGCEADLLDATLKKLSADGWNIRQVYHEQPAYYRVFAQREVPIS